MYKIGEDEMVICPYSCHHVVSKLRIQRHIMKCSKNNPHIKLAPCFYNYSHRLKPEDLLAHYETCPQKTRIDGARYETVNNYLPSGTLPKSSFPDINLKTQFFGDCSYFLPHLKPKYDDNSQKLETSDSESEDDFCCKAKTINSSSTNKSVIIGRSRNNKVKKDNELRPLSLPKTTSKALVYSKEEISKPSAVMPFKSFGRGKKLLSFLPPKEPRTTDHLLPDLSDMDRYLPKRDKNPRFFFRKPKSSCNESVVSSMLDDLATLKSDDIIFEDDFDDDGSTCEFILKNFDKYVKI